MFLAAATACAGSAPAPTRARDDSAVSIPSAGKQEPAPRGVPRPVASGAACPIVPLKLLIRPLPPAAGTPTTMLTLAADGTVSMGMMGTRARLDEKGCLSLEGEVGVDGSSSKQIWTPHERFVLEGDRILLAGGRSLEIGDDGSVVTFDQNGAAEHFAPIVLEGYRRSAACAARVLLITFFVSMPSMAASDGNPPRLPTPPGSPCF